MNKFIFSLVALMIFSSGSIFAEVTWTDDLESAKHSSKVFKKPILLWVGVHSFRTRPMILTEKPFLDLTSKIICVNLNPKEMTDEQKEAYGVDNSNFSKFYYYDIDFNLLGTENNPPNAVIANIHAMLKSIEAKEEVAKVEKEEKVTEDGAKVLWEKANRFEIDEKYDSMLTMLKQIVAKFPNSSYADLAKLKIEKVENDPSLKILLENQRKEESANRALKSVDILIKNNKKAEAIKKLNSVISDFPGTKAAKDAGELLDKLRKE